jgi:hypothetical protein
MALRELDAERRRGAGMPVDALVGKIEMLPVAVDEIPERAPAKVTDRVVIPRLSKEIVTARPHRAFDYTSGP